MRYVLFILSCSLGLSGCSTLNLADIRPEKTEIVTEVPSSETGNWVELAPDALPAVDWIASFNDPNLQNLSAEALERNANLKAAEASYRAALARLGIAEADLLPSISGSVDASRTEYASDLITDTTSLSFGVNASWEADVWGRIRDQVDSSELSAAAFQADYAAARLSVAGQVAQTWFNLIEARLLTELSERDVITQERALRLTTRRFEGGISGSSDVRLARSSVANAQAVQASRRQLLSSTSRALEVLLRRYPAERIEAIEDLPELPPLSGAANPAYVLTRRPDILAVERRMQAAGLDVDVARKALLPSLTLRGGVNAGGSALNNIFDVDALVANLVGGLTQPIFQGGRLKANIEQSEAILKQQMENYTNAVLTAYLEVENALDAETRLSEREAALRVSVDEALQAERRLERRYSEGLATILQLLDAQTRRISAESQLISARKERLANRVRLHVALGGGLETSGVLSTP